MMALGHSPKLKLGRGGAANSSAQSRQSLGESSPSERAFIIARLQSSHNRRKLDMVPLPQAKGLKPVMLFLVRNCIGSTVECSHMSSMVPELRTLVPSDRDPTGAPQVALFSSDEFFARSSSPKIGSVNHGSNSGSCERGFPQSHLKTSHRSAPASPLSEK